METAWGVLKKLKTVVLCNPAISLMGIYPKRKKNLNGSIRKKHTVVL
jgi:hypothetical protein